MATQKEHRKITGKTRWQQNKSIGKNKENIMAAK